MRLRLMLLSLCVLLTAGCGQVTAIHYVKGVEFNPADTQGLPLDCSYATAGIARLKGAKLLIQVEDPRKTIEQSVSKITPKLNEGDNWDKLRTRFELCYLTAFEKSKLAADVKRSVYAPSDYKPDFIFKIAVTEWHEGNKWLRSYLGFGLGATRLQTEGMLIETRNNHLVYAFADASVHPGGPSIMGFPRKVWRGPDLLLEDFNLQSYGVAYAVGELVTAVDAAGTQR